ncbi:MAG: RagB/SusD family nutrient uptake outer membrane protein [Bacteroidales bacterium]
MNKIKLYTLIALTVVTTACSDFLTRYPDTAIPEEEAMTDLREAGEVVLGIYSGFKNSGLYSGALTIAPDLQSDYVYAVKGFTNTYGDFYRWDVRPNDSYVEGVYGGLYKIASRCNFFMDYKGQVESTLKTKADWDVYNRRLADVHFARAIVYADLIRRFCEAYDPAKADTQLGISLVDTYRGADKPLARASLKDSYAFVLADLDMAEKLNTREGADAVYFTKGAIWALKSRIYLYMKEYAKSKEYAEKVIEQNYYQLADATRKAYIDEETGQKLSEYEVMWRYDESKEIIWKIAMSNTDRGGSLGRIFLGFNSNRYYPDYIPGQEVLNKYDNADTRYYAYFVNVRTGYPGQFEATIINKYPGNPDIDAGNGRYFVNMPKVLRLSEVYLNYAEACAEMGETRLANQALTSLRKKRIMNYGAASHDDAAIIEAVREERFKELIMEGFRLADLKRWGKGFERKKQNNTIDGPVNNQLKVTPDRVEFTWPIPQHEIDASSGVVQPNPSNKK